MNQFGKAVADLEEVLRLDSKHDRAHRQLAIIYFRCPDERFRDLAKARESVERACKLSVTPGNRDLAAAISGTLGDFAAAIAWESHPTTDKRPPNKEHIATLELGLIPRAYEFAGDRAIFGDLEEFFPDRVSLPAYR